MNRDELFVAINEELNLPKEFFDSTWEHMNQILIARGIKDDLDKRTYRAVSSHYRGMIFLPNTEKHMKLIEDNLKYINQNSKTNHINSILRWSAELSPIELDTILRELKNRTKLSKESLKKQLIYVTKDKKERSGEKGQVFDENIDEKSTKLMKNPSILSIVNNILEYEMTGDEHNRLFYFIINEARKYKTQLVRPQGQTAAGKNYEISWFKKIFPNVFEFASSTSAHFIRKIMQGELDTKESIIIHTEDRQGSGKFSFDVDQIYGSENVKVGFCAKEGGDWEAVDVDIKGPTVFYTTSTISPDEHRKSRTWATNPNESLEQNKRISRWIKWKNSMTKRESEKYEDEIEVLECLVSKLKKFDKIIIPYWDFVFFQHTITDDRRKENNFRLFIKIVAHIYQHQRPRIQQDGELVLISLPQDLFIAWEISKDIMELGRKGLTNRQKDMLEIIKDRSIMKRDENGREEYVGKDKEVYGGGNWFKIEDCLNNPNWDWGYMVTYNNFMDMKEKCLTAKKVGRYWLFTIKEIEEGNYGIILPPKEESNILSSFIKVSDDIFKKKKLKEGVSRIFSDNKEICKNIFKQIDQFFDKKYPNPFSKKITYVYKDGFIKREDKEGDKFFKLKESSDILLKQDKESEQPKKDMNHSEDDELEVLG